MKLDFYNHPELDAFIRLLQEIVLTMEAELLNINDMLDRYETLARIELIEELYTKVAKKQFNSQKKNSVDISRAVALILFKYRQIEVDIYANILKNRIVQNIHQDMV